MLCSVCKIDKLPEEFKRLSADGPLRTFCKVCANDDTKRRRNLKRDELFAEYKVKCDRCGYDKCQAALDFHHVDNTNKLFTIGAHIHYSYERLVAEIKKCTVLCANCHRELEHSNKAALREVATSTDLHKRNRALATI